MPKIYIACLASYNAGILHGVWIDCDQDADQVNDEIKAMLAKSTQSGAEEYAIHDYEGFGSIKLSEWEPIEKLCALAKAIEEHGTAFELFYANESSVSIDDAVSAFEERYAGEFESLEDWAYQYLNDSGGLEGVPKHLENYIDFEAFGRDAQLGGDMYFLDNGYKSIFAFHS